MTLQNHIVVPVDFSEQSIIALGQTYNLARITGSDITLVYVIDSTLLSNVMNLFTSHETQESLLRTGIQTELDKLAVEAFTNSGISIKTRIEKGKIYEEIVKVAEELSAAFIIMGTSGESTIKKKFIGSNAVRVINEAHCPVITIKGKEHRKGCKTIVLPLDFRRETKEKVVKCIEIARFFSSAVKVISVIDTSDEFLVNKLTRQMDQVTEFISSHQLKVTGELVHGKDIAEEILIYAKKSEADLIMIMTQQELIWTEYFIGTASQEIINNSEIPVCSIRPIERKDTMEFTIS
ncbi:MAG: universal stress protein [Bacteroidota bacterium]